MHADESGMRAKGKLHGLPVVATDKLTDDTVHAQRGQTAMEDARILPDFKGWMHDHWKPYFGYVDCSHAFAMRILFGNCSLSKNTMDNDGPR
ncbi:MAG: hypothetical protein IPL59_17330 [Candidatus Competibacteraceae bacterium]|nr:hypothetical protein [Candidatus Competibacteraceae bacterium]